MTFTMLGVVLLLGAAALFLLVRILGVAKRWREPTTHWVRRSSVDRRRRRAPAAAERRKGPRRQDEVARQFLDELKPRPRRLTTTKKA